MTKRILCETTKCIHNDKFLGQRGLCSLDAIEVNELAICVTCDTNGVDLSEEETRK